MKYKFLCLLLSLIMCYAKNHAQYENIWAFGKKAGGLDFNSGTPVPIQTNMGVYPGTSYEAFGEGSASICDSKGQLLFYTEGFYVWDKNGNVMPNGRDLTPRFANIDYTPTSSTTQGTVIVPMPGDQDKYYIFSLTAKEQWQQSAGRLYYSIVDMSLNGGAGDIVTDKKGVFVDSFLAEKMTATIGNRCNIWLLACSIDNNGSSNFKAYEITASGVSTSAVISNVGLGNVFTPIGAFVVSPNGKKIIATQTGIWGGLNGAALFDFDPNTGQASNLIQLLSREGGYGVSFSPNNTKAYVSTLNGALYQYDLSSNDPAAIAASEMQVGTLGFSHLKLGPDGKIYFIYDSRHLGVINFPNNAGAACGYMPQAVQILPGQEMHASLPNVVPIIPRKDYFSAQKVTAPCWANVNQLVLNPVNPVEGWDYIWHDGETGTNRVIDTPGTYWLSYYTPPCNYNVDTFYVTFPYGVLPDIHIQNSCNGTDNGKARAGTYWGDTVTYHYVWSDEDGDTLSVSDNLANVPSGNYILNIRTASCDTTLSFFIPDEERRVSFTADSIICQGTALGFTNTSDSGFMKFLWDFGDQDSSSLSNPTHVYDRTGTYQVTLTGTGQVCKDRIMKTIIVDSLFSGAFVTDRDSICTGESIVFFPQTDSSAQRLNWSFGDGIELTSGNARQMQHAFDISGIMRVKLTMQFRVCPDTSFTDSVYVEALPIIDLGPDAGLCLNGSPVILRNLQGLPVDDHYYLWSTGDSSANLKAVHPGIFSLTVKTKLLGCSSTESITVTEDCRIDIPNAFTPNGDGTNDYFFPRQLLAKSVTAFKMQIFNRWGQLLFESKHIDGRGWDGKFNGNDQPGGVYIYLITATFKDGNEERYEGNVTLIR